MKMSDIVKETTEMTSASVAPSMVGNGFVGGGPGTITRAPGSKKKKRSSKKT